MKKNNINQMEINEISMKNRHYGIIESLLFASGNPLDIKEIAHIIASSTEYTYNLLEDMKKNYNENSRGISLINMKEEYSLVTKPENSHYLQKLLKTNNRQALSRAALEALAIIVYKQPITRIEIDEIRGVKSDKAIQTLVEKEIIKEAGRKKVPGRPIMYATTGEFLKYFGLEDLNQMPTLSEFIEKAEEE
ncbi:segregation and condensation protein B [Clostridium botulinum]|uniref:SMC-Scp complex subunit ScpB n=1 Tax=Clostridium botulinum TaxID=1491 RepID=UPI0006A4DD47|nr:SMC-Scp complex subunit ScpB [Clostridium botulinum]KOC55604.1 segregation and condensation protein B [Clostridium botulinum]KOC57511.1 segregation and condensation protein B [Clostridium botulinum]